jgi:MerR family transcriptional regulator/heat shock protein HspR
MIERQTGIREKFHNLATAGESESDWDPVMSIGTAAAKVNLSVSAVRKYEKEGLLIYYRTPTGRRLLSRSDLRRVEMIQHMIGDLGLNMVGIRRLLALLPCWTLKPCDRQEQVSCNTARDGARPCWMLGGRSRNGPSAGCRDCAVYRYGAYCTETIKSLLHNLDANIDESD